MRIISHALSRERQIAEMITGHYSMVDPPVRNLLRVIRLAPRIWKCLSGFGKFVDPWPVSMALGSTQPLTEMSTRGISWDKGGR